MAGYIFLKQKRAWNIPNSFGLYNIDYQTKNKITKKSLNLSSSF